MHCFITDRDEYCTGQLSARGTFDALANLAGPIWRIRTVPSMCRSSIPPLRATPRQMTTSVDNSRSLAWGTPIFRWCGGRSSYRGAVG